MTTVDVKVTRKKSFVIGYFQGHAMKFLLIFCLQFVAVQNFMVELCDLILKN